MHIVVIFHNIGGYHAARLRASYAVCQQYGYRLTAIQVTNRTHEHPWGDLQCEITFPLKTLLTVEANGYIPRHIRSSSKTAIALLSACLDDLKPDAVAIPGWGFPVSRAALSWCQRDRTPAILMSESKWDDKKRYWWQEKLKSWLYIRKYAAALVGSQLHRDYLIQLGLPKENIFFGYDAVDNDYFARQAEIARQDPIAARRRQPKIPNRPYFLAVTRLIRRKNICLLVEAFAVYRQRVGAAQAWDLVICGSGEEEPCIRELLLDKKLTGTVHLPGFIPYQSIGDWYGLAYAFIHPALQEQWGLVVNEACAAGLPILCSHTVGASYDLITGNNGFLFNPDNQEEMTAVLLDMHHLDPDSRNRKGKLSQKIVANYAPSQFANGLINAVEAAMLECSKIPTRM